MPSVNETPHAGGYIISEANGNRSRDNGTLILGQNLAAGTVLGRITASGKLTALAPGAANGSQTAVGVLYEAVNATAADAPCVLSARDCEVNGKELGWGAATAAQIATATGQLAAAGIVIR
jgi:hypothetical protein